MPNLNGRLYVAFFGVLLAHGAIAATLLAKSEWRPGAFCYRDDSNYHAYRMAVCDCVGYQGSNGENLPDCPQNSTMTVDACVAGIKSTSFSYSNEWNYTPDCMSGAGMVTRNVKYVCYNASSLGTNYLANTQSVCDCADMNTGWIKEDGASSPRYTRRTGTFECGEHTFSTYCEYQMMDPETEEYTTYNNGYSWKTYENFFCGPTHLTDGIKTEYSCEASYYLKNGTTCTDCPSAGTIDGVRVWETSAEYNTSTSIKSCYVPADSFSVDDETGKWTYGADCNYGN